MKKSVRKTKCTSSISRALVVQLLDGSDLDNDYKQGSCEQEISRKTSTSIKCAHVFGSPSHNASLQETRSWLDAQCANEQALVDWEPEFSSQCLSRSERNETSGSEGPTIDTTILERIRAGRGPCDPTYGVDLLAAVRLKPLGMIEGPEPEYVRETYQATSKALLKWNTHISTARYDPELSKALIEALDDRVRLFGEIQKGTANPSMLNKTSLSSQRLLQALYALRPEIAEFKMRNPIKILYILWAHVGIAVPDMDTDLKYATMRALLGERLLKFNLIHADKRRKEEEDVEVALRGGDMALAGALKDEQRKNQEKLCKAVAKETICRVRYGRMELKEEILGQLRELTLLQAAQKWALGDKTLPQWTTLHQACADEDANLWRTLLQTSDDLEASSHALDENAQISRRLHRIVLTRVLKFAGLDLDCDDATREQIVKERMDDPDTMRMMSEAVADLASQRSAAEKVVGQVSTVDSLLGLLLDAAQEQWRAYDGLLHMLKAGQGLGAKSDLDAEMVDKCGPDGDKVVLMTRELQATDDDESGLLDEGLVLL